MSSQSTDHHEGPLDLARWRIVPVVLMVLGGLVSAIGAFYNPVQFGYSWLQSFMFFLSIMVGGLFLTLAHHMFDASWSVPIRRINEHLACLALPLAGLFIPIAILAKRLYPWMTADPQHDHALHAKYPLFTTPSFYIVALICFTVWIVLSFRLRYWSLRQDESGSAECTYRLRRLTGIGIFLFAITVTFGAIMWMKALMHEWFSTMYGVYYFAGSVWTTLATVYLITAVLRRQGPLRGLAGEKQFYFIGSLLFAFTVFYAYVTFSQYFIIWNANMPEETFWYVLRERGTWMQIGMLMIFGHFFVPFLTLLRIDVKLTWSIMIPLTVWAWLMHYCDMAFNVGPTPHPGGFMIHWMDVGSMAFMAGLLAWVFLKWLYSHPIYPLRDPRMAEGLEIYIPSSSGISTAPGGAK